MNINNRLGRLSLMTAILTSFDEPSLSLLKKKRKRVRIKKVLTKKQRKLRAKNKAARKSRAINRK